jgi:hypothetical protein
MRTKIISATTLVALTATLFVVGGGTLSASTVHRGEKPAAWQTSHSVLQHRRYFERERFGAPAFGAAYPTPAFQRPGFYYIPKVGIVGEACNLPTSACPNQLRDIQ